MGILDFLFGNPKEKIQDYLKRGAIILDVRTEREYQSGAIKNARNIPLD
jgi:rhodanese-related sulfurtransferase